MIMTRADLDSLRTAVAAASGSDRALDAALHRVLGEEEDDEGAPAYSASVDACLALIHRLLPDWAWHVGFGPRGIVPYAYLHRDEERQEANAPTVPLALLAVMLAALQREATIETATDKGERP